MKNILARSNLRTLSRFARADILLAFDYDGTLAPIAPTPESAHMRRATHRLLERIVQVYPSIVITGRSRRDVGGRVEGIHFHRLVGNHGIEPTARRREYTTLVHRWRLTLVRRLARLPGVIVEDKGLSLAVHYRLARNKRRARAAIRRAVASLPRARIVGGKQVVNIVPEGAPNKGHALELERIRLGCDAALYIGDDVTDEDVFSRDEPDRLLAIRVGPSAATHARYCIRDQRQIDVLLRRLVGLRMTRVARTTVRYDLA